MLYKLRCRKTFACAIGLYVVYRAITGLATTRHQTVRVTSTSFNSAELKGMSAYRLFGLSEEKLMQTESMRPTFNFSLLPWKMESNDMNGINSNECNCNWCMIAVVKSACSHWMRRIVIRDSWALVEQLFGVQLKVVFILGSDYESKSEIELRRENRIYGDLLQIKLKEEYRNVGMKTLAGMQWVAQNFPPHWIYTSADDDMLPDLSKVYEDIEKMMHQEFETNGKKLKASSIFDDRILQTLPIHCGFLLSPKDPSMRTGKWAVTKEEYLLDIYPPFCHGGWYSMPVKFSSEIYQISRNLPFFRLDDVWITSLLRLKYFDSKNVQDYFGVKSFDINIGIWPQDPHLVQHIGNARILMLYLWNKFKRAILWKIS